MGCGKPGTGRDGILDQANALGRLALGGAGDPQEMQGIVAGRIGLEDLAVQSQADIEIAGLVMGEGLAQQRGWIGHAIVYRRARGRDAS